MLQWRAIQRLKELGGAWYDLGGVNKERNPGVFIFKDGMGGESVRQLPRHEFSQTEMSRLTVTAGEGIKRAIKDFAASRVGVFGWTGRNA